MGDEVRGDAPVGCPVARHDSTPCGRPAFFPDGHCICHGPTLELSDSERQTVLDEIAAMLGRRDYDFTGFEFPASCIFNGVSFNGQAWFARARFRQDVLCIGAHFAGPVDFEGAVFDGRADFTDALFAEFADFQRATFGGEARFARAVFSGHALFRSATFHSLADFDDVRVLGYASFESAVFEDSAGFDRANMHQRAVFDMARFRGDTKFGGVAAASTASFDKTSFEAGCTFASGRFYDATWMEARFAGETHFSGAQFAGIAIFMLARFGHDAVFRGTEFVGEASFSRVRFGGLAAFEGTRFASVAGFSQARFAGAASFIGQDGHHVFASDRESDFRGVFFGQPEQVVFQQVFLGRTSFEGADVSGVEFAGVEWARLPSGRRVVWDELCLATKGNPPSYALVGRLYRQLKGTYEDHRDPVTAGDFHYGEMEMRRLANPPRNCLLRFLRRNLCFLALYKWISGYGEDYLVPLAWIAGAIFAFALLFTLAPCFALQASDASGVIAPANGFAKGLLHSAMCFLLRGDRPYQPARMAGHYLSVAESVVGPPLVAMFVLALNRRFRR